VATVSSPTPRRGWGLAADSTKGLIGKIALLAFVAAIAVALAMPLYATQSWVPLAILGLTTAAIFFIYLQPWHVQLKYLLPGTIFLVIFQIYPAVGTLTTAFTNFGDGHRGTKVEAATAIQLQSVKQVAGSTEYVLTVAAEGDATTGPLVLLLYDRTAKTLQRGDATGLAPFEGATVSSTGKVTAAPGLTLLNLAQATGRSADLEALTVPTANGRIKASGVSRAYEQKPTVTYDPGCDCITNTETGVVYTADESVGLFVSADGVTLPQGWQVNVGLGNFTRAFTDPAVSGPFLGILAWNFMFAILSVAITFAGGLFVAVALNSPRLKALRIYRLLIVLPYAMPSFAMLLVWRDMFNADFGLINNLTGIHVNWFGDTWTARFSVLVVQFWLGYPYMFLVCLGALQSIPPDLVEAAAVDGAKRFQAFRAVVFPLLLVSVAPLLISSFAYNFNNFNIVQLMTAGAPFPPDNVKAGGTDILVSYVYRLAFAQGGAQYGFAAAVSIMIFLIVAVVSIIGFRRTAALEEINR